MDLYYSRQSVGTAILLSVITCGIYGIYWLHQILSTLYRINNQPNSAGTDIVLIFVTCGIYGIYLMYKMGKLESEAYYNLGLPSKDDSGLYLILAFFGMGTLIACAIVQSNINRMADGMYGHNPHGPGPHGFNDPGPRNPLDPHDPHGQGGPHGNGPRDGSGYDRRGRL